VAVVGRVVVVASQWGHTLDSRGGAYVTAASVRAGGVVGVFLLDLLGGHGVEREDVPVSTALHVGVGWWRWYRVKIR